MISIKHENSFFIILSKPHGISVHNEKPSLLDWLSEKKLSHHFVNRLDQQTSGLMVIAQKPEFQESLQKALQNGEKNYLCLLRGNIIKQQKLDESTSHLIWDSPLSDKAEGRKNPQGLKLEQKPCLTNVKLLRSNKFFTEALCTIKTGRQHQIRKHAALYGHPIVGDSRYNDEKYNKQIAKFYNQDRLLLHAYEVKFKFQNETFHFTDTQFNLDKYFI